MYLKGDKGQQFKFRVTKPLTQSPTLDTDHSLNFPF